MPLDRSMRPLRPGILYCVDTRATAEIAELEAEIGSANIEAFSLMALSSQAVGPKIRWLRQHDHEVWRATARLSSATSSSCSGRPAACAWTGTRPATSCRFTTRQQPSGTIATRMLWHRLTFCLSSAGQMNSPGRCMRLRRAKDPFVSRSQEALAVWRTELGRAVFNMRLSTATPTAASVRWPGQAACAQARANDGLEATHRRLHE